MPQEWPFADPPPDQRAWERYQETTMRLPVAGGWLYAVWAPGIPGQLTFVPHLTWGAIPVTPPEQGKQS